MKWGTDYVKTIQEDVNVRTRESRAGTNGGGTKTMEYSSLSILLPGSTGDNSLDNSFPVLCPLLAPRNYRPLLLRRTYGRGWHTLASGFIRASWLHRIGGVWVRSSSLSLVSTVYLARCRYFVRPNKWLYRRRSAGWRTYLPISVAIKAILCRQHCGWLDTLVRHVEIVIADVEVATANTDSTLLVSARADTRRFLILPILEITDFLQIDKDMYTVTILSERK